MSIDKISCSKDEFFEILSSVCSELNIKVSLKSDSNLQSQYSLLRDNKKSSIRLYIKSDGLKFDTSVGRDRELNFEIEEKIKLAFNKTKHAVFTYKNISEEQFNNIHRLLSDFSVGDIVLNHRKNNDPNKSHFFEMKNKITNECITISKFKNGTVVVDGVVWILWEDICQIIEVNNDNISVNDIIDRILVEDEKVIVEEEFLKEEDDVKEIVSPEVYDFLDDHYKDYLISAQCILSNNYKMKEYSTVLCPVAKVLEGYLKSLLIELKLEKKLAIKEGWTFGKIFTREGIKSFNGGHITDKQDKELKELYLLVHEFRHDVNHGGPKPKLVIRDRNICAFKYREILIKIKESYFNIFE